jgi:hypothetical protein
MNPIEPFTFSIDSLDGMDFADGAEVLFNAMIAHYNDNVVDNVNKLIEAHNAIQ